MILKFGFNFSPVEETLGGSNFITHVWCFEVINTIKGFIEQSEIDRNNFNA